MKVGIILYFGVVSQRLLADAASLGSGEGGGVPFCVVFVLCHAVSCSCLFCILHISLFFFFDLEVFVLNCVQDFGYFFSWVSPMFLLVTGSVCPILF
jgi:hypothetical protein